MGLLKYKYRSLEVKVSIAQFVSNSGSDHKFCSLNSLSLIILKQHKNFIYSTSKKESYINYF